MIKIGYIDINAKASLLSFHSAMLRQGLLDAVQHIIDYLKHKHNSRLAFDASYSNIDQSNFKECYQTDFYEVSVEAISSDAPML